MTMTQDGNRERVGEYIVVEQLQDDLDDSSQVIGYNIRGPGADPTWLYTAEEVVAKLKELTEDRRS